MNENDKFQAVMDMFDDMLDSYVPDEHGKYPADYYELLGQQVRAAKILHNKVPKSSYMVTFEKDSLGVNHMCYRGCRAVIAYNPAKNAYCGKIEGSEETFQSPYLGERGIVEAFRDAVDAYLLYPRKEEI